MTGGLLDRATREAILRASRTGSVPAPRYDAQVYAEAVLRLVEEGCRGGEDLHEAYLRMRRESTPPLAALVLIHREQHGRERRALMH